MTTPTPPEGHELVPTCEATPHHLREWGFPVQGHVSTHGEHFKGEDVWVARRKAIRAGFCSDVPFDPAWKERLL